MTMPANEETIQLYMDAARRALAEARYNLAGEYWGVTAARAYYAYFYATCALLFTKDISRSSHSGVIAAFRQNFVKTGLIEPEFSDAIGEAFSLRQVADYDMIGIVDEVRAADVLNNAQLFVDRVVDYLMETGDS